MNLDRRRLFAALAGVAGAASFGETSAAARRARRAEPIDPPTSSPARSAADRSGGAAAQPGIGGDSFDLSPNAIEDQSQALQQAIDHAAETRSVLHLSPGFYRTGPLRLPPFAAISGRAGATRIVLTAGQSLMSAVGSDHIALSGLTLDGSDIPAAERTGLLQFAQGSSLHISGCEIVNAHRNGIMLEAMEGEIVDSTIGAADVAIFSLDARGMRMAGNTVRNARNGGILVWRSAAGDDGTLVLDNRIEDIANRAGGSGEYGNAVNVFRADNVIVRGNRIRNAAFSAVRGNKASNLQIVGNTCTGSGEVALYAEFGFTGAVIADNIVDGAAVGVSVTNFNQGGRLALVHGNLIRNLVGRRPAGTDPKDGAGIGIGVEADTAVTGNVIENAPRIGIAAGWGPYLRDVAVSGNVIRGAGYGIAVSVAPGAGAAVIADNLISEARRGAIVGMEWGRAVTGDLAKAGAARYAQLSISSNRVR